MEDQGYVWFRKAVLAMIIILLFILFGCGEDTHQQYLDKLNFPRSTNGYIRQNCYEERENFCCVYRYQFKHVTKEDMLMCKDKGE